MPPKPRHQLILLAAQAAENTYEASLKAHGVERFGSLARNEWPAPLLAAFDAKVAADEAARQSWARIREAGGSAAISSAEPSDCTLHGGDFAPAILSQAEPGSRDHGQDAR